MLVLLSLAVGAAAASKNVVTSESRPLHLVDNLWIPRDRKGAKAAPILTPSQCPSSNWSVGEAVLSNAGTGAPGLSTGVAGTIICFDDTDPTLPILACFPSWTGGHNNTIPCQPPILSCPSSSAWWTGCNGISPGSPPAPSPAPVAPSPSAAPLPPPSASFFQFPVAGDTIQCTGTPLSCPSPYLSPQPHCWSAGDHAFGQRTFEFPTAFFRATWTPCVNSLVSGGQAIASILIDDVAVANVTFTQLSTPSQTWRLGLMKAIPAGQHKLGVSINTAVAAGLGSFSFGDIQIVYEPTKLVRNQCLPAAGCNVCNSCCQSWITNQTSCDTCVNEECDVCNPSQGNGCTACSACCHDYITNPGECAACIRSSC